MPRPLARQCERDAADPDHAAARTATLTGALQLLLKLDEEEVKAGRRSADTVEFHRTKAGHLGPGLPRKRALTADELKKLLAELVPDCAARVAFIVAGLATAGATRDLEQPKNSEAQRTSQSSGPLMCELGRVPGGGIEPPTRGFSVPCSTD